MNARPGLDDWTERTAVMLSERYTRGAFISRVGRALLVLVGVGTITTTGSLLPVDRRIALAASCTDWSKCAMHGHPCENCGGSATSCPGGCTAGSSWTGCCSQSANCSYYVTFQDCCGCSPSCDSVVCNNSTESSWCAGTGLYGCTLSIIGCLCYDGGGCITC